MSEFIQRYHEHGFGHEVYTLVPQLATDLLAHSYFSSLDAIVLGGSYARGKWTEEEDIDADLCYSVLPEENVLALHIIALGLFVRGGLDLHIRTHLDRSGNIRVFHKTYPFSNPLSTTELEIVAGYGFAHPKSPFVARSEEAARFWHLML